MAVLVFIFAAALYLFSASPVFAAFNIDSVSPETITDSGEIITISVSVSGLTKNEPQYLQARIKKEGEKNYFGFTNNGSGEWKKYLISPADYTSLVSFTPVGGKWSGQIQAKIDPNDSDFKGSGNYSINLLKYITSSTGSPSDNSVGINIILASTAPTQNEPTSEVNAPEISFTLPGNLTAGSDFSIPVQIKYFSSVPYFVKVRIGPDESHLTHGQTYNNNSWLDDNDSWSKFPQISGPNWQGNVAARLPSDEKEGTYKIAVRFKKVENDEFKESNTKDVHFNVAPPLSSPAKTIKPSPAPSPVIITSSKTTPTIKTAAISNSTSEEEALEASVDGKILGISTPSSSITIPELSKTALKVIKKPIQNNNFPINNLLISFGLFIFGFSGVWLIRSKN